MPSFLDRLRRLASHAHRVQDALCTIACSELVRCGEFTIPELITLKVMTIPAPTARKKKKAASSPGQKRKKARKVIICIPTDMLEKRMADSTYVYKSEAALLASRWRQLKPRAKRQTREEVAMLRGFQHQQSQ